MALQQPSPAVTMDNSPAESFLSTPSDNFPSLFAASSPADTVNPMDMMTPQPSADDGLSAIPEDEPVSAGSPSDKKPTKKRKSWGQVLPEPKTNLPPRKRAKTDDEKEQRRVERVLRNRRAAQSSRERKRLEVEALEERNKELENMLNSARQANLMLVEELNRFRRDSGVATRTASPFDSMRDNQVTLSQELFRPQDDLNMAPGSEQSGNALIEELVLSTNPTVNPASLSPELGPVPDVADDNENPSTSLPEDVVAAKPTESAAPSSDLTQYPAVSSVGGAGQALSSLADFDVSAFGLDASASHVAALGFGDSFGLSAALDTDRHVLESGLLSSPQSSYLDDDHLVGDSATGLEFFDINDFLSDEANNVASDIMAASNDAAADHYGLEPQVYDLETQVSSENPNQQPQSGASSFGCDDGGIAVGV
jgi:transcriptional activator HAC1